MTDLAKDKIYRRTLQLNQIMANINYQLEGRIIFKYYHFKMFDDLEDLENEIAFWKEYKKKEISLGTGKEH